MSGKPKCQHNNNRYICVLCNPTLICEHRIRKKMCMKCNPLLKCQHNIRRSRCVVCNPSLICQHGKNKLTCSERECNPNKKCHTHNKVMCLECKPQLACPEHPQFRKLRCPLCGGPGICRHGKQKESCCECRNEGTPGRSFCKSSDILKSDCPCETCRYNRAVRGGIIKNKYTRRAPYEEQPQAQQGAVVLSKEPEAQAQAHEELVQRVAQEEQGNGGWYDEYVEGGVFTNEMSDDGWETEGGKRKRKRKQRFTRRLRRRNHNTKKSKIVKRKITKHSRKNKYKLK